MKNCPDCGKELYSLDIYCPSCKKGVKNSFTIKNFLWENFRLFTMVGVTGTLISLIPNMGTRILGATWITDPDSFLPPVPFNNHFIWDNFFDYLFFNDI